VFRVGHLLSILAMIRSAIAMASAMADSSAGEGRPSQFASFRAARMLAAMSSTRLRPSSTGDSLAYSPFVRLREAALGSQRRKVSNWREVAEAGALPEARFWVVIKAKNRARTHGQGAEAHLQAGLRRIDPLIGGGNRLIFALFSPLPSLIIL
jgi:hypothetical protein